jgi:hypothetical protein
VHKNFYNKVVIVDTNFLSVDECQNILNKVYSLRSNWQSDPKFPYLNFLPFALYTIPNHELYVKNVKNYKDLMYDNFKNFYGNLQGKLSSILDVELSFHDNLNYPGFHISNGESMDIPNFHTDGFHQLRNIFTGIEKFYFNNCKILSVIIPLSVVSNEDGLLYRTKHFPEINRQSLIYDNILQYTKGMLAIWDGNIQHSMKPFPIHTCDNLRITLQCHIALGKKGYIFW